ncbi:MAG: hypothetical protein ABI766_10645 [Gemmatimonadales bacterium]
MRRTTVLVMTVLALAGFSGSAVAQAAKPAKAKKAPVETATVADAVVIDTAPVADSVVDTTHHKKGLFGKAKGVLKNKVVQQVAKVAACNMVPGGQVIVGALDAASSKSAGEAASGAAGAATGSSCMPGMGGAGMGAAGMTGAGAAAGAIGGAGLVGLAGAGWPGATGPGGAAVSAPGMGTPGMPPMGAYGMGGDPKPMADCMGLTIEEYNAMTNPTNSEPRQATKGEMKRMQQLSKKVGSQRQMGCSQTVGMQQANAQMAAVHQAMAQSQAGGAPMSNMAAMDQAPTQPVELAADLAAELKKGKTVVRGIDWMAGSAELSPAGRAEFDTAMAALGQAVKASGQRYRLDLYVDDAGESAAPARLQLVQTTLAASVGDSSALETGKTQRDKHPRLEVVKAK